MYGQPSKPWGLYRRITVLREKHTPDARDLKGGKKEYFWTCEDYSKTVALINILVGMSKIPYRYHRCSNKYVYAVCTDMEALDINNRFNALCRRIDEAARRITEDYLTDTNLKMDENKIPNFDIDYDRREWVVPTERVHGVKGEEV